MLNAIVGDLGTGKTLFMTLIAVSSKREVVSNFRLDLPNYSHLDVVDLLDLGTNKDVLIDEAYTWLESRVSSSFLNRYLSYIMFQSRKRTIDIYTTEQLFGTIDVRFRDLVHKIVKCTRLGIGKNKEIYDFKYEILDVYSDTVEMFVLTYKDALKYFPIFDTLEIVEPYNKESMEIEILKERPQKLFERIESIALNLKKELKNITHASVKVALLKRGYNLNYESLVYACLKDLEIN